MKNTAYEQSKDIARYSCNDTLDLYDRCVCWDTENLDIKGEQWTSAYLLVWLYSYLEVKGNKKLLHYVWRLMLGLKKLWEAYLSIYQCYFLFPLW